MHKTPAPYQPDQPDLQADFAAIVADEAAFQAWRGAKLARYPGLASDIMVNIADPAAPSATERHLVAAHIAACNAAVLRLPLPADEAQGRADLLALGLALGLENPDLNPYADADAITPLHDVGGKTAENSQKSPQIAGRRLYIPYTNKGLNWHTDGYYNPPGRYIRAMGLYCVRAATEGGVSRLLDPEMAYLLLRDANPAWAAALFHPGAMTIPANEAADDVEREAVTGAVFSVNPEDGTLHMRDTARQRHVVWRDDDETRGAIHFLDSLFAEGLYTISHRLQPGEVILCNNVLHARSPFKDGEGESGDSDYNKGRLLLRARYHTRINAHTGQSGE